MTDHPAPALATNISSPPAAGPQLVYELSYLASLEAPLPVGPAPSDQRLVIRVRGGEVSGRRVSGTILWGSEHALACSDGVLRPDVRVQIQTDDGAHIYLRYTGVLELNEGVQRALDAGVGTDFGDQTFFTTPVFECSDERYAWLTREVFIGWGRPVAKATPEEWLRVEYHVYRVANPQMTDSVPRLAERGGQGT